MKFLNPLSLAFLKMLLISFISFDGAHHVLVTNISKLNVPGKEMAPTGTVIKLKVLEK
jgi:hypothetical protein